MGTVSAWRLAKAYAPMKLPSSKDANINAVVVGLEATNSILPSLSFANPMLPLVATLAILKAMLDSDSIVPKEKEQVTKVSDYLAEQLATMAILVYKSMPAVTAIYDATLCSKGHRQRQPGKSSCFISPAGLPAESCSP